MLCSAKHMGDPATPRGSAKRSPILRDFALHALTPDEDATCESMLTRERSSRLTLMPTHHVGEFGDLTGFR